MDLQDLLSQRRPAIVQRWLSLILGTYPAETSKFLKRDSDPFTNPVGHTLSTEVPKLYECLLQGAGPEETGPSLDAIIRIRAVQEFSASQAVAFVFLLKRALQEELERELKDARMLKQLLAFMSRIDELAAAAFDVYLECRERIYEVRVNEIKSRTARVLQRMNRMYQESEDSSETV